MKYVNCLSTLCLIGACIALFSCGGNTKPAAGANGKIKSSAVASQLDMLPTQDFLPVPKFDKAGIQLPYEAKPNPYTQQKGRVKKESIAAFIDAKRALKFKQYPQAEKILVDLTKNDKDLSGPWVLLGDLATEERHYEKAFDYYAKAIELNRSNTNAFMRLALAQRQKGDFLRAQNTYAKLLALWPDSPEAHLNLAVLYDIYLNHPLRAQKHMEAYQFLTAGENKEVAFWLSEIQERTGVAPSLDTSAPKALSKPVSQL